MPESNYLISLKRSLWNILAGTRGGIKRIKILSLLKERPYNVNQLHKELDLDYKTIQHHIKVLTNAGIITSSSKNKYGNIYFLEPMLEENIQIFEEILEKTGNKKINK